MQRQTFILLILSIADCKQSSWDAGETVICGVAFPQKIDQSGAWCYGHKSLNVDQTNSAYTILV